MGTHGNAHALNQSLNADLREDWTCSTELSSLNKVIIISIIIIIIIIIYKWCVYLYIHAVYAKCVCCE